MFIDDPIVVSGFALNGLATRVLFVALTVCSAALRTVSSALLAVENIDIIMAVASSVPAGAVLTKLFASVAASTFCARSAASSSRS